MKTWSFINGWHLRSVAVKCLLVLPVIINVAPVIAKDDEAQLQADMAFLEFLGESIEVDKEHIDPLRLSEYEQMIKAAEQEVKQQNE